MRKFTKIGTLALSLGLCAAAALHLRAADDGTSAKAVAKAPADAKERFFELRTYTTKPGRLEALHARFRDHTNKLFVKHGMELVGYWVPTDPERSKDTLIYVLAYPSKEAREKSWKDFQADPEWQKARAESEKDGPILAKPPESVYMTPTDYSPIK